ncbi:hypothetical protein [Pseudomonas sp. SO81]|uniref:hypothetical protein n=1 Tax=Pseudomonas sp. SO81 TaxID=2983246 RepID=UPI0025A40C64|nr:hypothetical protein [Pseudomonas sp. SO81]WJN60940.1 hypothetical protein OH686_19520 [Pseudomonas sp. SO81]
MVSLADERRAIGRSLVQQRTGQSTVDALNRVVARPKQAKALRLLDPRGALAAQRGRADWAESRPSSSGGAGVAWPLVETDYSARTYHSSGMASSDGLFFFPAIDRLVLTDAEGRTGDLYLAEPPA